MINRISNTIFHDWSIIIHPLPLFFSFISAPFPLDVQFRRCVLYETDVTLWNRNYSDAQELTATNRSSIDHRTKFDESINQFCTKIRNFSTDLLYWMFSCRGARNDRHRLLVAGFPTLYHGWIDKASSLSSLQDSSRLRVLRCSRVSCVERFDVSRLRKIFFRGDEGESASGCE